MIGSPPLPFSQSHTCVERTGTRQFIVLSAFRPNFAGHSPSHLIPGGPFPSSPCWVPGRPRERGRDPDPDPDLDPIETRPSANREPDSPGKPHQVPVGRSELAFGGRWGKKRERNMTTWPLNVTTYYSTYVVRWMLANPTIISLSLSPPPLATEVLCEMKSYLEKVVFR